MTIYTMIQKYSIFAIKYINSIIYIYIYVQYVLYCISNINIYPAHDVLVYSKLIQEVEINNIIIAARLKEY